MKKYLCILSSALFFNLVFAEAPASYFEARHIAFKLFDEHRQTLYCLCRFNRNKMIDLKSCGMKSASHIKRARRVEFEHMMPAENFGRQFKCWREKLCKTRKGRAFKGRKCCKKINLEFRRSEAELYNIWPAVGLINQLRSNYRFSPLVKKQKTYGCNFKVDRQLRKVEPSRGCAEEPPKSGISHLGNQYANIQPT